MNAFSGSNMIIMAALILLLMPAAIAGAVADMDDVNIAVNQSGKEIGVLVIAHGSDDEKWCKQIHQVVENVSLPYPVELGFLEFVRNESISRAVDRLDEQGVEEIIAVPLFASSYSSHIQEIEYVLRLRDSLPGNESFDRVNTTANIVFTRALDDHPLAAYILADRITEMSKDPTNETVVILSHGTDAEDDLRSQIISQDCLAKEVKTYLRYWTSLPIRVNDVKYAFIHGNETLYPNLTVEHVMENVSQTGDAKSGKAKAVVLPLMIAGGSFTDKQIPKLLEGHDCIYNGLALASHPNLAKWIENRVRCALGDGIEGILIVDHGSSDPKRSEAVRAIARQVDQDLPEAVAVAFAENAPENESIAGGIARLLDAGANRIIVVTLFTTDTIDHEVVRDEVYSVLGSLNQTRILLNSPMHMGIRADVAGPMDDHPLIAELLLDRAREVSQNEEQETLVLAPWGSSTYFEESEHQAESLAKRIKAYSNFKDVRFGFMEYQGSPSLREAVENGENESVIVVSVNSMGTKYVDGLISASLEGLNYTYNGKGFYGYAENLDPHPNIARWIEYEATKAMR